MSSTVRTLLRTTPQASNIVARPFHTTHRFLAYRDSQDRESLRPGSTEYTKSGRDDEAAAHADAAFNPSKTSPEEAAKSTRESSKDKNDPLDASGANQGISRASEKTTGAGKEMSKGGKSRQVRSEKEGSPRRV